MNAADAEELHQFKAWREIQGMEGYNPPWSTKVNNAELGFKNNKVNIYEVEQTQPAKTKNFNPLDGTTTDFLQPMGYRR